MCKYPSRCHPSCREAHTGRRQGPSPTELGGALPLGLVWYRLRARMGQLKGMVRNRTLRLLTVMVVRVVRVSEQLNRIVTS